MIKDRKGRIIKCNEGQNKALSTLYGTVWGRSLLKILTLPIISKAVGVFMDSPLSIPLIKPFIRRNKIDMRYYVKKNYISYNDFFTRRIRPSARPVEEAPELLVSPCDAKLTVYNIGDKSRFRIKNSRYSVEDLLNNKFIARRYNGGTCMIFRLCVDDYHRYCYIDNGFKTNNIFIPGELHTVNPIALEHYNIYKRNSREYTMMYTDNFGDVVQVEVGAMLVGKICNYHQAHFYSRGEEKGKFEFGGSTIVLLFEKNTIKVDEDILRNSEAGIETIVKYGERIGRRK